MTEPAGLILFDMDSTLIQIECIDQIASLTGNQQKVAEITERAMQGELDFASSLRERVGCLGGTHESQFETIFNPIPFTPGALELVQSLQAKGWRCVVVSGGFTWFAQRVAKAAKLDAYYANTLEVVDGQLTGKVLGAIVDAERKAGLIDELRVRWALNQGPVVAVGDGANDALMLQRADLAVAFCAKPALRAVADVCIDSGDLRDVLPAIERYQQRQ